MPKDLGNQDLARRLDKIAHNNDTKERNLRCCKNYKTISLISHPIKIMLRIILNRLKGKAEEPLSEEQADFRPKRGTIEQIFNIRLLIEKHVVHHQDLHHNFVNLKKANDTTRIAIWTINECSVTRSRSWTIVSNIGRSTPRMPFVASAFNLYL